MDEKSFDEIMRVQQMMSKRIVQEQRVDDKISVLNIIHELAGKSAKPVQIEAIFLECEMVGIDERQAADLIADLVKDNLIKKSAGYVQFI